MAVLKLTTQPNRILSSSSANIPIAKLGSYNELAQNMIDTMIANNGIGLAAPQVGKNLNLFVINQDVDRNANHLILANPTVTFRSKAKNTMEEGCLSCPGIYGDVTRPEKIRVKAYGLDGKIHTFKAKGLLAKVFQHEIDHLRGILIIQHFGK